MHQPRPEDIPYGQRSTRYGTGPVSPRQIPDEELRRDQPGYRYLVVQYDYGLSLEEQLNQHGLKGWRFSAFTTDMNRLIFEREFD